MRHISEKSAQQGFTLVEILVGAAILALGILAAAGLISRSTIQDARAYYMTQAALMAEEFLESRISAQYSEKDFNKLEGGSINRTLDGVEYRMNCVLTNSTPMDMDGCKEIVCTVNWNNKGLQSQVVSTYVYSRKN